MGNKCCSAPANITQTDEGTHSNPEIKRTRPSEQLEVMDPEEYDKLAVEILRKEFLEEPETFVLNQLLMSYMFFDDYLEDIRVIAHTISEKAQRLNSKLVQQHQKQFYTPDSVLEYVNKNVKFEHSDGPRKGILDSLGPQRMYILHDNIDIVMDDTAGYDTIDKPCYRATLEESTDSYGFMKVKLEMDANGVANVSSAGSTTSNEYNRVNGGKYSTQSESGVSTENNSDSEYDYAKITDFQTPKAVKTAELEGYTNVSNLPAKCMVPMKLKNYVSHSDSEDDFDVEYRNYQPQRKKDSYVTKTYIDSEEFMNHFTDNVFPYFIEQLGFSKQSIQQAKTIAGAIFCDSVDTNKSIFDDYSNSVIQYEIIPAISILWPEIAYEWTNRTRKNVPDVLSDNRIVLYKWPTKNMISECRKLHCVVIPKGFMPKRGQNPEMKLEWEVCFSKVERYLEMRMSHAQYRVFVYILILYKKFMEPLTDKHGLLVQHIRHLLFWEVEKNYKHWLEDKLWAKMKTLLSKLYEQMGKGSFPHYFVKSRNMFTNIPQKYLFHNQKILHEILEEPMLHMLKALKDVKYISEKFYPELKLDELINILKSESNLAGEVQLAEAALLRAKIDERMRISKQEQKKMDKEQLWNRRRLERERIANTKKIFENGLPSMNLKEETFTTISQSIRRNLNKKTFKNDTERQILILKFFITHFINIAKKSLKISSNEQAMFYLKQCSYLTSLLDDIPCEQENVKEYKAIIVKEEENCMRRMLTEVPVIPKRNSAQYAFNSDILQVKGKEINKTKLNKSYNEDYQSKLSKSHSKKSKSSKQKSSTISNESPGNKPSTSKGTLNESEAFQNNSLSIKVQNSSIVKDVKIDVHSSDSNNIINKPVSKGVAFANEITQSSNL